MTDGNLSRHFEVLAAQGLLDIIKGYEGRQPRTWVEITPGRHGALAAEMAALTQLLSEYEQHAAGRWGALG